jgi:hypothetical protein
MAQTAFQATGRRGAIAGSILLLALARGGSGHDGPASAPTTAPKEPICGFARNFHYLEEDRLRQGLTVNLAAPGSVRIGQPVTLRFYVCLQPGDLAVDNLQLEHEKFMHVIGVRDDLNEFFHIHPTRVAPGIWEVVHTFTNGGIYKIWSDVRFQDASYAVGHPVLSLSGNLGEPARHDGDRADYEVRSGHQITFKHTEPLVGGRAASLQFLMRDAAGREIETENFLGAAMHLVIVKDDLSVYLHAHPDHQETPQPVITFTQVFPKDGKYKLFAQFRPKGTTLPADEAILAEFYVTVAKGVYTPVSSAEKNP